MIAVLQRVKQASVFVRNDVVGSIKHGLLILLGVEIGDAKIDVDLLSRKSVEMRIFNDNNGKMNHSLIDKSGCVLVVSQFTLCANWLKGRRPSFLNAAKPEISEPLVKQFVENLRRQNIHVETGKFGARMDVALINDGPVTIVMDSKETKKVKKK